MEQEYELIITESDKTAILNIINMTTFKGADSEYVSQLKVRVASAPVRSTTANSEPSEPIAD